MNLDQESTLGLVVLAVLIVVGLLFFIKARKKKEYYKTEGEIDYPMPVNPRTDVKAGHFLSDQIQLEETIDHIGFHWSGFRETQDKQLKDFALCKERGVPVVLDVDTMLFMPRAQTRPGSAKINSDAEDRITMYFEMLRANNVLDAIKYITPTDEPNLPDNNASAAIPEAVALIKRVIAKFPELTGVKLICVYFYETAFPNPELFDVIGVNNYHVRSKILAKGQQYDKLKAMLKPGQTTILFPGAYIGQVPEPFYHYALDPANSEVEMVCEFLWADNIDASGFKGLRSRGGPEYNNLKERYIALMLKCKGQ